ncbi:hypothetical protein ACFWM1_19870 [Nocardia sp. NPDC058379]|uniref:hypothetical protein n=1 Tax=unclassified Nocardia TaxID=2637762 RepID=UPI0036685C61
MHASTGRIAVVTAVVTPFLAVGVSMGAGTAAAATPPTISVTLAGDDSWNISWDGSPAANCSLFVNDVVNPDANPAPAVFTAGVSPSIAAGSYAVRVECPIMSGNKSNTVTFYTPRGPVNDLRTQFSNATQGATGS